MTMYKPGNIVLIDFPFASTEQTKRRPALVLLDTGDADIVVARVTSQARQDAFDVDIADWQSAGLLLPSIIRLHKLATLEKNMIHRPLGNLQAADYQAVALTIKKLFNNW